MITMSLGPEARSTGYDVESKITAWMIPPKMLKAIEKMLMLAVKHTGHMYGVEHRSINETFPGVYQICGNYVSSCLKKFWLGTRFDKKLFAQDIAKK